MNNFDLEKLLRENYCDTFDSLKSVDKKSVYAVYENKPKGKVRKRNLYFKVAIAVILLALLAVGALSVTASDMSFRDKLAERARKDNVNFTDEELDELASRMISEGSPTYRAGENYDGMPGMSENEHGQKIGSYEYRLELFLVGGFDLNDNEIIGYVYTEDMEDAMLSGSSAEDFSLYYDDVIEWQNDRDNGKVRNWCYVFDENGTTIIGKWVQSIDKDKDELDEKHLDTGFVTNDKLETGEYDEYIYNGFDSEEYEVKVRERTENILK